MIDRRRLRLLAIVDSDFVPVHAHRPERPYGVASGNPQWFQDNIPCQAACPAHTDVPRYIGLIADRRHADSYTLNWEHNVLPGCLGRICARPCEDACRRRSIDSPVSICSLKRLTADAGGQLIPKRPTRFLHHSVAVVGAGPAGLSAARDLALAGFRVTIFERHAVPGGMLWAGIPSWRLPRRIIRDEVRAITELGVELHFNTALGRDVSIETLLDDFDAVLLATGCQAPASLGIPGEDLTGVESGVRFLERVNLEHTRDPLPDQRIVTIGGGYSSIDCARTTQRLGVSRSLLAYRRDRQSMPVSEEEIQEAEREGVEFLFMASPRRVVGRGGMVAGVEFVRNRMVSDEITGVRLEPIPGSGFIVECDQVIVAVGQQPEYGLVEVGRLDRRGVPVVSGDLRTDHPRVWAAGDYVTNPTNVISAVASGKRAAESIERHLLGIVAAEEQPFVEITDLAAPEPHSLHDLLASGVAEWTLTTLNRRLRGNSDSVEKSRPHMPALPVCDRGLGGPLPAPEVELGLSPEIGSDEAARCLQCQLNIFIDGNQCILCNGCVEVCPQHSIEMVPLDRIDRIDDDPQLTRSVRQEFQHRAMTMIIDETACIRCGRCVDRCPTGCLTMGHVHTVARPLALRQRV